MERIEMERIEMERIEIDRIKKVREVVDAVLDTRTDPKERSSAYIHLYGVAQAAALIAQKRQENVELAIVAAMLHDIHTYQNGDSTDHAQKGAMIAGKLLQELNLFSREEIELVCSAIYHHSDKNTKAEAFEEVLKDADVMQHIYYNPFLEIKQHEQERYRRLKMEFGIG